MLLGRRRRFTHVASVPTSVLLLARSDLKLLFASLEHRETALRLCRLVLRHQESADRLQRIADVLRIAFAEQHDPNRPALIIQLCWRTYLERRAAQSDTLYRLTHPADWSDVHTFKARIKEARVTSDAGDAAEVDCGSAASVDHDIRASLAAILRRMDGLEAAQAAQLEANAELRLLLQRRLTSTATSPFQRPPKTDRALVSSPTKEVTL